MDDDISNSTEEKVLGVYFDNKLNLNTHMKKTKQTSYSQKLHALAILSNHMDIKQIKLL